MNYLKFIPVLLLLSACSKPDEPGEKSLFSLSQFFSGEIAAMQKNGCGLTKTIRSGNTSASKKITSPAWEKELKPFMDAEIDKPAWKNSYSSDTSLKDSLVIITYTTSAKKAPVKRLRVTQCNGKTQHLHISTVESNSWFELKQELSYDLHKGYTISSEQSMLLSDKSAWVITGEFISCKEDTVISHK